MVKLTFTSLTTPFHFDNSDSEVEKSHKIPIKDSRRSKKDITSFIVKASSEVGAKTTKTNIRFTRWFNASLKTQEIKSVTENEIVFHSKVAGVAKWKCGA